MVGCCLVEEVWKCNVPCRGRFTEKSWHHHTQNRQVNHKRRGLYAGHRDHPETQPCRVRRWLGLFDIRQGVHTLISHVVRRLLSHQGAKEDGAVDCGCACLEKPRVSCITINWFERSLVPLISWWWKWVDDAWWKKFRSRTSAIERRPRGKLGSHSHDIDGDGPRWLQHPSSPLPPTSPPYAPQQPSAP